MGGRDQKRLQDKSDEGSRDKKLKVGNEISSQQKIEQFFGHVEIESNGNISSRSRSVSTTRSEADNHEKTLQNLAHEDENAGSSDSSENGDLNRQSPGNEPEEQLEKIDAAQEVLVFDSCMYTEEMDHMLNTVLQGESFLFESAELERFNTYKELDEDAKRLFVRLWMRKHRWIRIEKLNYARNIHNSEQAVQSLVQKGFMLNQVYDVETALELMSLDELKLFAKSQCISLKAVKTRASYLEVFNEHIKSNMGNDMDWLQIIIERIGACVKLETAIYELFQRLHLVYYRSTNLAEPNSIASAILSKISKRNYPVYEYARSQVWKTRSDLIMYEEALQREQRFNVCLEQGAAVKRGNTLQDTDGERTLLTECWTLCENIIAMWEDMVQQFCSYEDHYYRRRFDAGWVYTRMLEHGSRVLAKLHEYNIEALILDKLIQQNVYCLGKRGKWYDRLALIQSKYLNTLPVRQRKKLALQTCVQAIQDPSVHQIYLHRLYKRIGRLELDLQIPRREQHDFSHVILRRPKTRTVYGKRISDSITGKKSVWQGADAEHVSVEQVALDHYAKEGYKGVHSENGIVTMIFMLLFWDIVFATVPGVLETPYQTHPLDLGTDAFYSGRLDLIRERLELISNAENSAYLNMLRRVDDQERPRQTMCSGIHWDYELEDLLQVAECIGPVALAALCKLLAEEFGYRASGMPDLCCWNYTKKECIFAEVKGPGDKLSETQNLWIDTLASIGIAIEVCHVKASDNAEPVGNAVI